MDRGGGYELFKTVAIYVHTDPVLAKIGALLKAIEDADRGGE